MKSALTFLAPLVLVVPLALAACSSSSSDAGDSAGAVGAAGADGAAGAAATDSGTDAAPDGGDAAPGCTSDSDCASGETCDAATGSCIPGAPGCTSDADCAAGETCDASTGTCVAGSACHDCACVMLTSQGGCADICSMAMNGGSVPNFCDSVPALPQCAACLQQACPMADPTDPTSCQ